MKLKRVLFGLVTSASVISTLALAKAPVVEINANTIDSEVLTKQVAALSRKLDSRNKVQAKMQLQLEQLQNEVNELRGVTELHSHQLEQVLERQRDLYKEIDRRVNEVVESRTKQAAAEPTSTATIPTTSNGYSTNLTENEAYDRALNLVLKDKSYQQAIVEFKSFNQKFPNSSYAANAQYWLGQLLFNQGQLNEANEAFLLIATDYKQSSKRPDALLKIAMIAQKQNNPSKAIEQYQLVVSEYPDSSAA